MYTTRQQVFDGSSTQSSTYTSNPWFAGDCATLTLSLVTAAAVASVTTVQGSLDPGFTSALTTFSTLTVLTVPGLYDLDPFVGWVRVQRSSVDSATQVVLHGRSPR